jgi:hypothetical protein
MCLCSHGHPRTVNHSRFDARCHATEAPRPCCLRAVTKGNSGQLRYATVEDASGRPRLRDGPRAGPVSGGSPAAWVSRHVGNRGVADQGQGSMSFSRRVLHMDPCPWPAPRQGRRRDGIPTYAPSCPATERHTAHVRRSCLVPLACPFPRGLTGNHGHSRSNSLTVHRNTSLLTDRYGPHLCKAVLGVDPGRRSRVRPTHLPPS